MGKIQLSIHFARRFVKIYSAINGQNENTLKRGLVELAAQVLEERKSASMNDSHEEIRIVQQMRQWFLAT